MAEALYGERGFYRRRRAPAAHFRTAAHVSPLWVSAWARITEQVARDVDAMTVVEIGAGGGELLTGLAAAAPPSWRLVGVDVCPRPDGLADRVEWTDTAPASFDGVLIAVEWLDVVPVDVVERTHDDTRLVEVAANGQERLGDAVGPDAADWLARWWPLEEVGDRAEVGLARDAAWAQAVARLRRGLAVAVDYAAVPARDVAGTLAGYRGGRQVAAVPDASCDLTAHVLMQSCAAAVDGVTTQLTTQRDALRALGLTARRPSYAGDPQRYLAALQEVGEVAELTDPGGLGGFAWLMHARGVPLPF